MIILVKPSDYCGNAIRYATEKAKAKIVKVRHMPENLSAISMWHRMKIHCMKHADKHTHGRPMQYPMLTLVISPSAGEYEGWTMKDWAKCYDEVLQTLDSVDITKEKGCNDCVPTHFFNSMSVGALHSDSKSGVLHLHADICRLDMEGHTNQLHQLHIRAMKAADIINRRHGWKLPSDIREGRRQEISNDCLNILRTMPRFDMPLYFQMLRLKGYVVDVRSSKGKIVGYTVKHGDSFFKASELGVGRNLMATKLEDTWVKLHKDNQQKQTPSTPNRQMYGTTKSIRTPLTLCNVAYPTVAIPTAEEKSKSAFTTFKIAVGGKDYDCNIPDAVKDVFTQEAELPDDVLWSKVEDVMHTAMLLFCGYVDAATTLSESLGGGGGGTETHNWGRDKDEDDWQFAHRCLTQAKVMHKRPNRSYHR